jgi:hypothetical protein
MFEVGKHNDKLAARLAAQSYRAASLASQAAQVFRQIPAIFVDSKKLFRPKFCFIRSIKPNFSLY